MGKDFTRFKLKTNDKLYCNRKCNVPVCVISISGVVKKDNWYFPQTKLHDCFYECEDY